MIATKVFAIAAAILAVSEVEARRKRKIKDAVTRSCASKHHATFLIDGLSSYTQPVFFLLF